MTSPAFGSTLVTVPASGSRPRPSQDRRQPNRASDRSRISWATSSESGSTPTRQAGLAAFPVDDQPDRALARRDHPRAVVEVGTSSGTWVIFDDARIDLGQTILGAGSWSRRPRSRSHCPDRRSCGSLISSVWLARSRGRFARSSIPSYPRPQPAPAVRSSLPIDLEPPRRPLASKSSSCGNARASASSGSSSSLCRRRLGTLRRLRRIRRI